MLKKFILQQTPTFEKRNNRLKFYEEIILADYFIENKTIYGVDSVIFYKEDNIIVNSFNVKFDCKYKIINEVNEIVSTINCTCNC
jgi:hypothetical protein